MPLNRETFYAYIRRAPFGGRLLQAQVDGMDAILDFWESEFFWWVQEDDEPDVRHLAYALATEYHETSGKMQPVEENLFYSSAERIRAVWPSRFKTAADAAPYVKSPEKLANKVYGKRNDLGNNQAGDGWRYRGRGGPQVTGRGQYRKLGNLLGVDLVNAPERMLEMDISVKALILGMYHGTYTGKKLSDYFAGTKEEPKEARRIINGTDKAGLVEDYYFNFLGALKAAEKEDQPADVTPEEAQPDKPDLKRDVTTIGAALASSGAAVSVGSALLEKINNPYALGALAFVIIGLVAVFIGRYGLAKREGV